MLYCFDVLQAVQIDKKSRYLNRVTNLHHNVTIPHILYSDVLLYFKNISTVLEHNDFVVIDDVIPPSVLTVTVAMLQQSTIWFDISNGMSYFAHDNESLIFQAFHQLSKVHQTHLMMIIFNRNYVTCCLRNTRALKCKIILLLQ